MTNSDNTIQTALNDDDRQRFREFKESRNLNKAQAARKLLDRGLEYEESWDVVGDVALAATIWAVASTGATVFFDLIPSTLSMWSIVFAGVLLTTYAVHLARWRYFHD